MAPRKESQKPRGGDADEEKKKRDYTAQLRPAGLVKSAADSTSESTDKRGKRGRRESFDDPEYKPSAKGKVKTSKKRKIPEQAPKLSLPKDETQPYYERVGAWMEHVVEVKKEAAEGYGPATGDGDTEEQRAEKLEEAKKVEGLKAGLNGKKVAAEMKGEQGK